MDYEKAVSSVEKALVLLDAAMDVLPKGSRGLNALRSAALNVQVALSSIRYDGRDAALPAQVDKRQGILFKPES